MTPCDPCKRGDHNGCWAITSPAPEDRCACFLADGRDEFAPPHDINEAWRRASED